MINYVLQGGIEQIAKPKKEDKIQAERLFLVRVKQAPHNF